MKTYEVEVEISEVRKFYIEAKSPGEAESIIEAEVQDLQFDGDGEIVEAETLSVIARPYTEDVDD